ncbi:AbrB family transcriptional regulator [Microbaculum sp. FT89]|uniref:AbrB family transcriptional regulator n=1 Tax=Microbaculum sp. FT89 TaxID=3447298 RepID=UPI003F536572
MSGLPSRQDLIRDLRKLVLTLALTGAGGTLFALAGLPVPWISGPMIVVAAAALFDAPVDIPRWLREIVFFFLGLNIGSAVTPEALAGVVAWPASLLVLVIGLPVLVAGCALPLIRWRGWRRDDALMASMPGALSLVLALADATDADVPRIALVQALRVAILVALVPPMISLTSGVDLTAALPQHAIPGVYDIALLVVGGLAATVLIRLTRFPAAGLMGALVASAALHATDVVTAVMPNWLLMSAFAVLGAGIGARFAGMGWRRFRSGLFDALMTFAIGFAISLATAIVATVWLGFPFGQTVLAFSPGAFEAMVVLAFLLGLDAAYVGAHHTVRFVALVLLAPVVFRRRPGNSDGNGDGGGDGAGAPTAS